MIDINFINLYVQHTPKTNLRKIQTLYYLHRSGWVCIYLRLCTKRMRHRVNILGGAEQVLIQSFPSRPVAIQGLKCPTISLLVIERIVGFIPYTKVINARRNTNSLVQDLNLGHRVHFHGGSFWYCRDNTSTSNESTFINVVEQWSEQVYEEREILFVCFPFNLNLCLSCWPRRRLKRKCYKPRKNVKTETLLEKRRKFKHLITKHYDAKYNECMCMSFEYVR